MFRDSLPLFIHDLFLQDLPAAVNAQLLEHSPERSADEQLGDFLNSINFDVNSFGNRRATG